MDELLNIFKALSDSNRIRILKILETRSLCVCEITEIIDLATSTVSSHLNILKKAGLIVDYKDGKWVNYSINKNPANTYLKLLLPLIESWVNDEKVIVDDKYKAKKVNREKICGG